MFLNFIKLFLSVNQIMAGVNQILNFSSIEVFPKLIFLLRQPATLTISTAVGYAKFITQVLQGW